MTLPVLACGLRLCIDTSRLMHFLIEGLMQVHDQLVVPRVKDLGRYGVQRARG